MNIEVPSVVSQAILSIDYVPTAQRLEIVFVSGRRYGYAGVPAEVYAAMLAAPSKGEYFNAHIRNRYPFTPLD